MRTAIEQTNAAIALKADSTTVTALGTRVDKAEQKLTPEAISSSITSSALYAYQKSEGRNYCLNSTLTHTFIDNHYRYESGTTSTYTTVSIPVSDDLFEHSGNGAVLRLSVDIKRTDIDAAAASTAGVYGGIWVYYRYVNANGDTAITGRGWYFRTTDASFKATDDDWVRVRYGPMSITAYDPLSIAYVAVGTASATGATGTMQYRM